jgi:sulfonate transport system substrate-binding protein
MRAKQWLMILIFAELIIRPASIPAAAGTSLSLAPDPNLKEVRVAYQKGGGNLAILKHWGLLEKQLSPIGVRVSWSEFPAGPQLMEMLNAGAVDFGPAGDTPPIFAQAASGSELVYVAAGPPAPEFDAIIVPKGSPIKTVADLKGKRVALNLGSAAQLLLVRALGRAGLTPRDVETENLAPADAHAAFQSGSVDAWVIWYPYITEAQQNLGAHILLTGKGLVDAYVFYFSTRTFAQQHTQVLQLILRDLDGTDSWIAGHTAEAAQIMSSETGVPVALVTTILTKRLATGVLPVDDRMIASQQQAADSFYSLGLLPVKIDVAAAVWRPTTYPGRASARKDGIPTESRSKPPVN